MSREISGPPAESGRGARTTGDSSATALIAQLFRQVLRLQPRNDRSVRPPASEAGEDGCRLPPSCALGMTPETWVPTRPPVAPAVRGALRGEVEPPMSSTGKAADADTQSAALGAVNLGEGEAHGARRSHRTGVVAPQAVTEDQERYQAAGDALEKLSRHLERLCERGAQLSQNWSATLQPDPQTLPETLLRIQASPSWIRLRFSTQSATSVHLISGHAPALRKSLEEALNMKDQVDIDFE